MISKLRRKFIIISMLSVTLVLTVLIAAINIFNYRKVINNADDVLNILEANEGEFPPDTNPDPPKDGQFGDHGGGRKRDSIVSDAMESVIAACFLDGGMDAALKVVQQFILVEVPVTKLHNADYKTQLQELVQQKKNQVLSYRLVGESGPDHDKMFQVEVSLNGVAVGTGTGRSKKRAEQDAARVAMETLFPQS